MRQQHSGSSQLGGWVMPKSRACGKKGQTSDNGQHNTLLIGHRPNIPGQTAPDSVTSDPELETTSNNRKRGFVFGGSKNTHLHKMFH